jgi:hypothetical protein
METTKPTISERPARRILLPFLTIGLIVSNLLGVICMADLVEMTNGDHYSGAVLSVTLTNVAVRSEVQGAITLPRSKVARITFGQAAVGAAPEAAPGLSTAQAPATRALTPRNMTQQLQPKGADTNFVGRIQNELLTQAGPEASRKYSELARGFLSGTLSVDDLRKQAQQTIKDAEAMKQDLGPDASETLDGYLEILRAFIGEATNNPAKP